MTDSGIVPDTDTPGKTAAKDVEIKKQDIFSRRFEAKTSEKGLG